MHLSLYKIEISFYICQVQQAAASGRPMAPGTKLMSPDGVIGIVTANNTISLTLPQNYSQRGLGAQLQRKFLKY